MDTTGHNSIDARIEALLFYTGDEFKESELKDLLDVSREELEKALQELENKLQGHGLTLLRRNEKVQLGTHPDTAPFLTQYREEQFSESLGKAALETLTIILYEAPITKVDIDYLRGVNSATTLRQLLIRGLIEKTSSSDERRGICYTITADTLRHLGISSPEDLPHFDEVKRELEETREYQEGGEA